MRKLISILIILFFQSINSFANGCVPEKKAEYQPIYGLCKFIRSTDAVNLKYLVEAYNPSELIMGLNDESEILAALKNVDKAVAHLKAMPEGKRTVYIGGAMVYDLFEADGTRYLKQFDIIKYKLKESDLIAMQYESPWMDNWSRIVQNRLLVFTQALKDAGVSVDYIMLDYEEKGPANYEINAQDEHVWDAIMADPRWPALRQAMGLTDEEFKKGLNKNGDLVGTRTDFRAVAAKWNISQERKRVEYFDKAIASPFRRYWPSIRIGSYEDGFRSDTNPYGANCFRFTNMWGGIGAIKDFASFEPSENLRYGQNVNTPSGDIFTVKDSWDALVASVQVARANAQEKDGRRSLHWLTGPDYYKTDSQINVGPYYKELLIQVAMNDADALFFQTSSWSTKEGHQQVDSILKEINDIGLGYSDRHLLTKDNISYVTGNIISGVLVNGKTIWRVSWPIGKRPNINEQMVIGVDYSEAGFTKAKLISECETGAWFVNE